jgi:dTDP-4-amino-4,6-dideoxygalactose transaminase
LSGISGLTLTKTDQGSAYHLYVVRAIERDTALRCLNEAGIGAAIHYPIAVHELDAYRGSQKSAGSFPESEAWSRECLTLPMYPELPDDVPGRAAKILRNCPS